MAQPPKWTPAKDLDFYSRINLEAARLYFREMEVHKIDRTATVVDERYGESKNIVYKPYAVRAQCIIDPKKTVLRKMGLDDDRELIVNISLAVFKDGTGDEGDYPRSAGGFPIPEEGDLFILEGERFKVMDEVRTDYWWHTEAYLNHQFSCTRLRDRSISDEKPADANNPAGPVEVPIYSNEDFPGDEEA